MTDRPILMSAPMVLACLREIDPKTHTRRMVKGVHADCVEPHPWISGEWSPYLNGERLNSLVCPYGVPGDTLWVRETLRRSEVGPWVYGADYEPVEMRAGDPRVPEMVAWAHHKEGDTCVSIHMPRWASRISLRVTDVRVERLQAITDADALAEGVAPHVARGVDVFHIEGLNLGHHFTPRSAFMALWKHINGEASPKQNPWVWVVEFERT